MTQLTSSVPLTGVAIESHRDAPGRERACAERIAAFFSEWGLEPELVPVMADRPNVYCTLPGSGGGCTLMLNGHTDAVPAYEMGIPPFEPQVRDGLPMACVLPCRCPNLAARA